MSFLRFMSTGPGRAIRVAMGAGLIALGLALGGAWVVLAIFGLLPLATGAVGLCPVSPLFGEPARAGGCRHAGKA